MDFKKEKEKRIKFLREIYKVAKEEVPTSPTSAFFGLSKTRPYNLLTKEFKNNDEERGGYIIGEQLGLNQQEVDSIVIYFSDREVGYMSSTLGLGQFNITQSGVMYLESLVEKPFVPLQIQNNLINVGDINSPTQFQQGSNHSTQTQEIAYTEENINKLFTLLKADFDKLSIDVRDDLNSEIEYASKQLKKGKSVKTQLLNIGGLVKDVGINVFANLIASPIFEIIKPAMGL
jgi:hypothetical protein